MYLPQNAIFTPCGPDPSPTEDKNNIPIDFKVFRINPYQKTLLVAIPQGQLPNNW